MGYRVVRRTMHGAHFTSDPMHNTVSVAVPKVEKARGLRLGSFTN